MRLLAFVFAFLVCLTPAAAAAPNFPALTGRVVDDAHILSDQTEADLDQKLAALEAEDLAPAGGGHPALAAGL